VIAKIHFRIFITILFIASLCAGQKESDLFKKLKSIEEITEIQKTACDTTFSEAYEIMVSQPIDHNNPNGQTFNQRIFLSFKNFSAPVVFITEGYSAQRNYNFELSKILDANQLIVEHRYFGKSVPAQKDWQFLNIEQSAADHHNLVTIFKKIFSGKWLSTGISKGGQTTIFFKKYYPEDIDVAVPYVAPVNLAQEDPRIYMFLNSVGTKECREKIINFQRAFLSKREEILKLLLKDVEKNNLHLAFDYDFVLEYMTLEYSFAFWQWGFTKCEDIPSPEDSADVLYKHMINSNPLYFYTEEAMNEFGPFYVQAYNEIGYYGYDLAPFKDLLREIKDGSNIVLVPKDAKIEYNCCTLQNIYSWLQKHGNNILYIYGQNDTWSATAVQLTGETNAVKMVKANGAHGTRIRHFVGDEKEKIYSTLEKWLDISINR